MHYELRIVVEKVAVSSQEVVKRDTLTSYDIQCPTSIGELGLRHAEQIALLGKVQNIVLAEQSLLLDPGMPGCPTCGNTLNITPFGRTLTVDRRTPWSRGYIPGTQSWAYLPRIHRGI